MLLCVAALAAGPRPIAFSSDNGALHANGVPFTLKGAIWRGADGPGDVPEGLAGVHAHSVAHYMQLLAAGSFNAVRLDFNHNSVLNGGDVKHFDPRVEPGLVGKRYLQALHYVAEEAAKHGLLVALACTRLSAREAGPGNGLWHSQEISEADVLNSWTKITNVFCSQPNVFAVDLFDAPHGATWGVGGQGADWHAAAQRIGNHVLAGCPRLLVMVQGARSVAWAGASGPEFPPGLNLMGVRESPLRLSSPSKLVYAPNLVPPSEHMLPAYRATDFPTNLPTIWSRQFGFVPGSTGAGLVFARAGGLLEDPLDKTFQESLFAWAAERRFGFFYDCLNANPSNGGLLHKDWETLRTMKTDVLLNGVTATKLSSLPPPPPSPAGVIRPINAVVPSSALSPTEIVCVEAMRATGLRGALDWQTGGTMSTTVLSIYAEGWAPLLFEVAIGPSDHSVYATASGESRLLLYLNASHCFPSVPVLSAAPSGAMFCFQLSDVTRYGKHVRYVNRGCGTLQRLASQRPTITLNDGGEITLIMKANTISAADSMFTSLLMLLAFVLVVAGVAFAMRRSQCARANLIDLIQSTAIQCLSKLMGACGFTAIAKELARRHSRSSSPYEPGLRPVKPMSGASGRDGTLMMMPSFENNEAFDDDEEEVSMPTVSDRPLDDVHAVESVLDRAMSLLQSPQTQAQPSAVAPMQVPTISPPPRATAVESESEGVVAEGEGELLASITALLSESDNSLKRLSTADAGAEAGSVSADMATASTHLADATADLQAVEEQHPAYAGSEVSMTSILHRGPAAYASEQEGVERVDASFTLPKVSVPRMQPPSMD